MKVLLVNPRYADTFWSFRYALPFIAKQASYPPLALLTVAGMLPPDWEVRLADLNVAPLRDDDVRWADYVLLSGISAQRASVCEVIDRCTALGVPIVAGGPLFTQNPEEFPAVAHLVLHEAEITLPAFLADLAAGRPERLYTTDQRADVTATPLPRWDLLDLNHYAMMSVQYSRGCPFDCEFCDITVLYGRVPRTKTTAQVLAELEALYTRGWRGGVFLVDDNFIGNKAQVKGEILPAIAEWMAQRRYPFMLFTEASINLADDPELMALMAQAGFNTVFIGIESPNEDSLVECRKIPNRNRNLLASVQRIQRSGLQVQAGFIVGFDHDPPTIFERVIDFIQESGIAIAMVGLLNAPRGTRLHQRLQREGRLIADTSGDNTDFSTNFVPRMAQDLLVSGYRRILETIYAPPQYYARVQRFLRAYRPHHREVPRFRLTELKALWRSVVILGILNPERRHYWRLILWSLFTRPRIFPLAVTLAIFGYHFRKNSEAQALRQASQPSPVSG